MNKAIFLFLVLAMFLVSGCASNTSIGTGTLEMQITDAPTDLQLDRVLVTIANVQVHVAGAAEEEGWKTIVTEAKSYDLIALTDVKAFLGTSELAVGKYTQVRLDVTEAVATIKGVNVELTIPSKTIKLVQGFEIVDGETTKLTLDFDAKESISETAQGKYLMRPTIKVIQE
jgi:hypothetical protein